MTKKELQALAPELLAALEALYKAYAEEMLAEYNTWDPDDGGHPEALNAKRLIDLAKQ